MLRVSAGRGIGVPRSARLVLGDQLCYQKTMPAQPNDRPAHAPQEAGVGAPGIEITDEMVDAAVGVLRSSGRLQFEAEGSDEDLVVEILLAALDRTGN